MKNGNLVASDRFVRVLVTSIAISALVCSEGLAQTNVTINGVSHRAIGRVGQLDRARYFTYHGTQLPGDTSIQQAIADPNQLNALPGRAASDFDQNISAGLPEDPARPGFYEPTALVNELQGPYRNFVLTNNRYAPVRNHPNPLLVYSGRANGDWPSFIQTDPDTGYMDPELPLNAPGYADFLTTYLRETSYGPNAYHPVAPGRLFIELVNEPNAHYSANYSVQDMIDFHVDVAQGVKATYPQAQIGGYSACCSDFVQDDFGRWFGEMKPFIDQAGADIDFISIHPYDRYTVKSDGTYQRDFAKGASHTAGQLDLLEAHSSNQFGKVLPFSFTEYGSWNRTEMANGSYGSYTRQQQQWDLVRDIREKFMVFLERPDRVVNATPFILPRWWFNDLPTPENADNVLYEQDAAGNWTETIVGNYLRMMGPISGQYVGIDVDHPDLQAVAFKNGDQLHVILNNLQPSAQAVDLSASLGTGSIANASMSRIFLNGLTPTFESSIDVSSSWQNLTLSSEEAVVLTLTLNDALLNQSATNTTTTYGHLVADPITQPGGRSSEINVSANLDDAVSATLRVGYSRPGESVEAFDVLVNGTRISVSGNILAADDGAYEFVSREVEVPLNLLNNGNNIIQADFLGNGGRIGAIALEVTRSIGDFNDTGALECGDLTALVNNFGAMSSIEFDLTGDGVVNSDDGHAWIEDLRGAKLADLNFDAIVDISDFQLWLSGFNGDLSATSCGGYDLGDMNFDGLNDHTDFVLFKRAYDAVNGAGAFNALIPEPRANLLLASIAVVSCRLRRKRQARA